MHADHESLNNVSFLFGSGTSIYATVVIRSILRGEYRKNSGLVGASPIEQAIITALSNFVHLHSQSLATNRLRPAFMQKGGTVALVSCPCRSCGGVET